MAHDSAVRGRAMQTLSLRVAEDAAIHEQALVLFRRAVETETDPWPAASAVRGIERILGPDGAEAAWTSLLEHHNPAMVKRAAMTVTDVRYIPALITILKRSPEVSMRETVSRTLGRMKDPAAFEALVEQLADPRVRAHAVEALGDLGDARAIPHLELLVDDPAEAWAEDNHGPMLCVRDLARGAIARLR